MHIHVQLVKLDSLAQEDLTGIGRPSVITSGTHSMNVDATREHGAILTDRSTLHRFSHGHRLYAISAVFPHPNRGRHVLCRDRICGVFPICFDANTTFSHVASSWKLCSCRFDFFATHVVSR